MDHSVASYYSSELDEWSRFIQFCMYEIEAMENRLSEVIQRDTIPGIALKTEAEQAKLERITRDFRRIKKMIAEQLESLKKDHGYKEDRLIAAETENRQQEIRDLMQMTEKSYVETKYECYSFLSSVHKAYRKP